MRKATLFLVPIAIFHGACVADDLSETDQIIQNLVEAGYSSDDIRVVDGDVFVGNDALVTLGTSREMLDAEGGATIDLETIQYTTNNLVAPNIRTICVFDVMGSPTLTAGLNLAMSRYNSLGLNFTFKTGVIGCDAMITAQFDFNAPGGVSGFPQNGMPFGSLTIHNQTALLGVPIASHVIAHELGHTIGFRHSDFFDRSISCAGAPTNEGDSGVGANLVPGTPGDAVINGSLMNSCFNSGSTGEFTATDITALQTVY
ncbi:MAG: M57 family metalloprotease [Kofleriaceae bacterium]